MISIIVPVLNEEIVMAALLDNLTALCGDFELIIADGGSDDNTANLAEESARVLYTARGRAAQCNAAAAQARGKALLFLHADSHLATNALTQLECALAQGAQWGCFKLRFDENHPLTRIGAVKSNLRARISHIVFGDQGLFITRELFKQVGGFPELPLMEDYQLSLNLKKLGIKPLVLNSVITTSARRFRAGGRLRVGLRMHWLRWLYRRGVPMERLVQAYKEVR